MPVQRSYVPMHQRWVTTPPAQRTDAATPRPPPAGWRPFARFGRAVVAGIAAGADALLPSRCLRGPRVSSRVLRKVGPRALRPDTDEASRINPLCLRAHI